jgi:ubiquinone biosynthesis protein
VKAFDLFSNAVRTKEIAAVLVRNGFADLWQKLDPPAPFRVFGPPRGHARSPWESIRSVLEELGPTFIKFGQLLSMRPDALPEPLILELRKLQKAVKPQAFEEIEGVLVEELGRPIDEVFSEFERESVASASLAQVYFARLRSTGEPVAVKVQRPHLAKTVEADFDLLAWFARQAHQRIDDLRPFDLPSVVEEMRHGLELELDFRNEARHATLFNLENPHPEEVFAPRIHEAWTSRRLLVMERIEGRHLPELPLPSEMARLVARRGAQSIFRQIMLSGFFHADPHSGNLMVTDDGRVCFLDWGLAGHLTRVMRRQLLELFGAFLEADTERIARVASNMGRQAKAVDLRRLEREALFAVRENYNPRTGQGQIGRAALRMFRIFGQHGIPVAQDFALTAKAVLSIEEAAKQLDPGFDLRETFTPVIRELQREEGSPVALWRKGTRSLADGLERLQELPGELHRVLKRLEEDSVTVNFQHRGLEELDDSIESSANKITLAVIIAALVIGSSLIITTGIPPKLFGYPAIGIVGYLLSALLGIWVVIDILRSGRHRR